MKVVIPVGALHVGGGCRALAQVANALAARGHDVDVVIPWHAPIEYKLHCRVTKVPGLTANHIPYGDIVLPNFYTTFGPAFEAWPAQCVRLCQGFEPMWVPNPDYALWTYSVGVPVISISHWLDELIYQHVGTRGRVVNLGVDPKLFHPSRRARKPSARKVILYVARDPNAGYPMKGFYDFAESVHLLKHKYHDNIEVKLICPEKRLSLPGVRCRVYNPKNDREMAHLYRSADVFVSTSWYEGFGLPPLEAMACGTPVVTTNSGGVMDFCKHHYNAYVAPPRNPKRIARGIHTVLDHQSVAKRYTVYGPRTAAHMTTKHFERRIVRALEAIYAERTGAK